MKHMVSNDLQPMCDLHQNSEIILKALKNFVEKATQGLLECPGKLLA